MNAVVNANVDDMFEPCWVAIITDVAAADILYSPVIGF